MLLNSSFSDLEMLFKRLGDVQDAAIQINYPSSLTLANLAPHIAPTAGSRLRIQPSETRQESDGLQTLMEAEHHTLEREKPMDGLNINAHADPGIDQPLTFHIKGDIYLLENGNQDQTRSGRGNSKLEWDIKHLHLEGL